MQYYIYILYTISRDAYDVGDTGGNLRERNLKHNTNHNGFTGHIGEWMLMYFETFQLKSDAMKREKRIKGWKSRKLIGKLIKSKHPDC